MTYNNNNNNNNNNNILVKHTEDLPHICLPPFKGKVTNEWSYTSTLHTGIHGIRHILKFFVFVIWILFSWACYITRDRRIQLKMQMCLSAHICTYMCCYKLYWPRLEFSKPYTLNFFLVSHRHLLSLRFENVSTLLLLSNHVNYRITRCSSTVHLKSIYVFPCL
jgi:hypothetical protein